MQGMLDETDPLRTKYKYMIEYRMERRKHKYRKIVKISRTSSRFFVARQIREKIGIIESLHPRVSCIKNGMSFRRLFSGIKLDLKTNP